MTLPQAAALSERQMTQLLRAYVERQRWTARVQAVAVVNALGESMQGERKQASLASLAALGFRIEGHDGDNGR